MNISLKSAPQNENSSIVTRWQTWVNEMKKNTWNCPKDDSLFNNTVHFNTKKHHFLGGFHHDWGQEGRGNFSQLEHLESWFVQNSLMLTMLLFKRYIHSFKTAKVRGTILERKSLQSLMCFRFNRSPYSSVGPFGVSTVSVWPLWRLNL